MERYLEFALNHYILVLALAVVTYLLIQEFFDTAFKKFQHISPLLAVNKMNIADVVIIDVRDAPEFVTSHINEAINISLDKIAAQLTSLEKHKEKIILITCQNGTRSASAAKILSNAGFKQVFVITGGMTAWENDYKLPVKLASKNKNKAKVKTESVL